MTITRRAFILGSASAISLAGIAGLAVSSKYATSPYSFIHAVNPTLYDLHVGNAYYRFVQPALNKKQLLNTLCSSLNMWDWMLGSSTLDNALRTRIQDDYRHDRILNLAGWVLPETSVYLSALAVTVKQ